MKFYFLLRDFSIKNFEFNTESFSNIFSTAGDLDLRPSNIKKWKRRLFEKKLALGDFETETRTLISAINGQSWQKWAKPVSIYWVESPL